MRAVVLAIGLAACGHIGFDSNADGGAPGPDAGDASLDASADASADASTDASVDAGPDACVPLAELCNGIDDDCDPATPDGAGEAFVGTPCDGPDLDGCREGAVACLGGALGCDDASGDALEEPAGSPACTDGVDNDCDEATDGADTGCADCQDPDVDGDGADSIPCGGLDCDDTDPDVRPSATEGPEGDATCSNGLDDDCDGLVDDAAPACGCVHPQVVVDCQAGWCRVPAGCFSFGSPESELCRENIEDQARVTLTRAFEMSTSEVTQADYEALVGDNPAFNRACGGDCPVERVSWHEAAGYCNTLSLSAGLETCYDCGLVGQNLRCSQAAALPDAAVYDCPGYRLPTEAEWEYAARAGVTGATGVGEITDPGCRVEPALDAIAWYDDNSTETQPVCSLDPNGWGLCDVLGNTSEWTHDEYVASRGVDPVVDPVFVPADRSVARGGAFLDVAGQVRLADRYYHNQLGSSFSSFGFRCVRTLP